MGDKSLFEFNYSKELFYHLAEGRLVLSSRKALLAETHFIKPLFLNILPVSLTGFFRIIARRRNTALKTCAIKFSKAPPGLASRKLEMVACLKDVIPSAVLYTASYIFWGKFALSFASWNECHLFFVFFTSIVPTLLGEPFLTVTKWPLHPQIFFTFYLSFYFCNYEHFFLPGGNQLALQTSSNLISHKFSDLSKFCNPTNRSPSPNNHLSLLYQQWDVDSSTAG